MAGTTDMDVDYERVYPHWCYRQLMLDLFGPDPDPPVPCCPSSLLQHDLILDAFTRHIDFDAQKVTKLVNDRNLKEHGGCILRQALRHYYENGIGAQLCA